MCLTICLGLMLSITWRKFKCMICCTKNLWQEDQEHIENNLVCLVYTAIFHWTLNVPISWLVFGCVRLWKPWLTISSASPQECSSTSPWGWIHIWIWRWSLIPWISVLEPFFCVTHQLLNLVNQLLTCFPLMLVSKTSRKGVLMCYLCFFLIIITHGSLLSAWLDLFLQTGARRTIWWADWKYYFYKPHLVFFCGT